MQNATPEETQGRPFRWLTWLFSGVFLSFAVLFAGLLTVFAHDAPTVPAHVATLRSALATTISLVPVVWIVALILSIVEANRRRRRNLLKWYARAPFFMLAAHLLVWLVLLGSWT